MNQERALRQQQAIRRWTLIGAVLTAGYILQAVAGWQWGLLVMLQERELYKQITGFMLVVLLAAQWRLSTARINGTPKRINQMLSSHRVWGACAPLLLYLHADEFGHAYIRVLSLSLTALLVLGLLYQPVIRCNRALLTSTWLLVHVALASLLVVLIGYHAFNAFYYE